ncbi:hypothetical protein HK405_001640 [Cladochytrium tenue]|nr:hypothetical protein HK405_001640 [Cladochytrium tenue]
MDSDINTSAPATIDVVAARAQLRQDAACLWIALALKRPAARLHLYNGTPVEATLVGADAELTTINVDALRTPLGTYPRASLRANDCRYMVVDLDD